ncbi:hypothetical protein L596_024048 [Steinernema carpocapsae]|uniref:Uncharacterized protein n=1 Tax=Steinernema carpocapsae TaxID=34508 RepID=A0A4U5MFI6_STECR|nr:hypothetical protein L596_024048 [Steinernema carpocapsae]
MVPRAFLCFFFALIAASNGDVGSCTRKNGPASWLTTKAHGLLGWGTAGTPPTGPNFCLQGSEDKSKVEVDYHIRLTNSAFQKIEKHTVNITKLAKQNACIDQNPEIHYCVPFCQIPSMQKLASEQAVASADPQTIAEAIYSHFFESNEWVVTVLNVDWRAVPQAHLDIQSFMDPSWCSVYIGIDKPEDSYLLEIQIARILN